MAAVKEIVKLFEQFGTQVKEDLQKSLRSKQVTYGGGDSRLSNNIRFVILQQDDKVVFQLLMPGYGFILDKGRGPTKHPGDGSVRGKIQEWAKRKAIVGKFAKQQLAYQQQEQSKAKARNQKRKKWKTPKQLSFEKAAKQLSFLIARKIHREGYKATHFYSEVVKKTNTGDLQAKLAQIIKKEVIVEIKGT